MKYALTTGLFLICLFAIGGMAVAQISEGGLPPSFSLSRPIPVTIPTASMSPIDLDALSVQDKIDEADGLPLRFGTPFDVDYSLQNSGLWQDLGGGDRLWRLRIESKNAFSINLLFSRYHLPDGARLYIYNEDHSMLLGAFTSKNNKPDGQFATGPVKGDISILEYVEPAAVHGQGDIAISRIVHAYKDVFGYAKSTLGYGSSGSCNVNINCPQGQPWQNEKRAVAMILTGGGTRLCTGTLVNNARQDQTPYLLTANHCSGPTDTWVFMFKYESPTCVNADGPTTYTVSGSSFKAASATSDFTLVQLSEMPPANYDAFYAGWSNLNVASQSSVVIHHPSGDIKKISLDLDSVSSADYLAGSGTTHWMVGSYETGTTEPGSSGSPLFDQNHHVVGQLHGGYASCGNTSADWYGKFALSWTGGGTPATRLKDWLDPDNSGIATLNGFDPSGNIQINHTGLPNTKDTVSSYDAICAITATAALNLDSLYLHYQIASVWNRIQLQSTGGLNQYHAAIPPQKAGTVVNYFLTAADINGLTDTTSTYTFQIEYSPSLAAAPLSLADTLRRGDSASSQLIINSVGNGSLTYTLSVAQILWQSKALAASAAQVKSGAGPDSYGYVWIDSDSPKGPVYSWVDITATGTDIISGLSDDNHVGPYPIGFSFPYYGGSYTQFHVGSNGTIAFDSTNLQSRNKTHLPATTPPSNLLAWLWDDLNPLDPNNPGAHVYYKNEPTRCIIEFVNYPRYHSPVGAVVTAEVILQSDGAIIYQYHTIASNFRTDSCSVGIENAAGTIGLQVAYLSAYLKNNLAVKFYVPYPWLTLGKTSGTLPPGTSDTIPCIFTSAGLDSGVYLADIVVTSNDADPAHNPTAIPAALTVTSYVCGDANRDGRVNVGDAVYLVNFIFKGGPSPQPLLAGDANNDHTVNIGDCVYIINYVFKLAAPPCAK
jgi:hypothetical protein